MKRDGLLPNSIPIFPLPGALLLPRAQLPLHIFEPRYIAMVEAALRDPARIIGMIQPDGSHQGAALHRIGCAGRITQFSETSDGRYMITLTGLSRFRMMAEVDGFTPFRRAEVDWTGFDADRQDPAADTQFDRPAFLKVLNRYLQARKLKADWEAFEKAEAELLINSLSMLLDFDPEDKQALLEAPCLRTRRETLIMLMEYKMRGGNAEGIVQ